MSVERRCLRCPAPLATLATPPGGRDDMRRIAAVLLGPMFCVAAHAHVQPGDTPPDAPGKPYGSDKGIPVMVMPRRDGTVAHVHVGYGEDMLDTLVGEINELLAGTTAASSIGNAGDSL